MSPGTLSVYKEEVEMEKLLSFKSRGESIEETIGLCDSVLQEMLRTMYLLYTKIFYHSIMYYMNNLKIL